jgi:hypothetical protein
MQEESVAAPRLVHFLCSVSWGSRPRLIIFRRSAARTERRREFSARLGVFAAERRRRDRYLAWGVSPRYEEIKQRLSPWKGRQMDSPGREPRIWL